MVEKSTSTQRNRLVVLYEDSDLIVIDKPSGYFVHQPENKSFRVSKERVCLALLRNSLKARVYPVHRLDVATSGILVFAKNPNMAKLMAEVIQSNTFFKTYHCIARGHLAEEAQIETPLKSDSSELMLESKSLYKTLDRCELNVAVGKKHSTARYSLVELTPLTGRYHQLRRHLAGISHPIVGDREHGDSHHNRFFREKLDVPGLLLRSTGLKFNHPISHETIHIAVGWNESFKKAFLATGLKSKI